MAHHSPNIRLGQQAAPTLWHPSRRPYLLPLQLLLLAAAAALLLLLPSAAAAGARTARRLATTPTSTARTYYLQVSDEYVCSGDHPGTVC